MTSTYTRKKSLFDEYFDYHRHYVSKYGPKTIVLFEVGSFYCMYGISNPTTKLNENIIKITDLLRITLTRADKRIVENSATNPLMCGIPNHTHILTKYMKILVGHGYTVVLVTQRPGKSVGKMNRKVQRVYSPSTYIEDSELLERSDSNCLMGIYFDSPKLACMTVIDLSTGAVTIYTPNSDILDSLYRFKKSWNPREYTINYCPHTISTDWLDQAKNYLDLPECQFQAIDKHDPIWSPNYQNEFLLRVYPRHQFLTPVEYIDLEKNPLAVFTFIKTIQFAYDHDDRIIRRLAKPQILDQREYLVLENKSVDQLNLISDKNEGRFSSLLSIIDHTHTAPGRRKLKTDMVSPLIDHTMLQERYDMIEAFLKNRDLLESVSQKLSGIVDFERRHRKMALGILNPAELYRLDQGYEMVQQTLPCVPKEFQSILPSRETIAKFTAFIQDYRQKIDLDEAQKYHLDSIKRSFFRPGVSKPIDTLHKKVAAYTSALEKKRVQLSRLVNDAKDPEGTVQLEFNERDHYHYKLTKTRYAKMKKRGANKLERYTVQTNNNSVKLTSAALKKVSEKILAMESRLESLVKKVYLQLIREWDQQYSTVLQEITHFMATLDVIQSHARTAIMYSYHRPIIDHASERSYFEAKNLRNPLAERINTKTEFVPNDICFGKPEQNLQGILLFSVNGCGKSTLLKSIAMTIVMAQMGSYVPATLTFSPFQNILTRIGNQDNIFKGQSTFQIEMIELRAILNRAGPKSLVITDELCAGTENSSATAIMAATIIELAKRNVNFVFATHLHNLVQIPEIADLANVKTFHLKVECNEAGELIYNRKLSAGPGDSIYGLEIAKHILHNKNFIKTAMTIRKSVLGLKKKIIDKRSRYNKRIFVDKCEICQSKERLEVHHIHAQCTANQQKKVAGSIPVHQESNLVVLCSQCHYNTHLDNICIHGWQEGVESGRHLNYELLVPKEKLSLKVW